MARLLVAALLAFGAVPALAEPSSTSVPIQPAPDSAAQRQALRSLTACLAQARPRWARQTLAHAYLSEAQASLASQALAGTDNCIRGQEETDVTFRTSSLVGSLAEHFLATELQRADFERLSRALSTMAPLNVTEDFALCVAARNPAAARDLALSEPGSPAEAQAAGQVAGYVARCTGEGERLTVDLQALRALTSTALYRGVTTVLSANN